MQWPVSEQSFSLATTNRQYSSLEQSEAVAHVFAPPDPDEGDAEHADNARAAAVEQKRSIISIVSVVEWRGNPHASRCPRAADPTRRVSGSGVVFVAR
jgi:hypothetical protein